VASFNIHLTYISYGHYVGGFGTLTVWLWAIGRHYRLGFLQDFPCFYRPNATHPERITAIFSQNGNAYEQVLSEGWNPIQKYWRDPRVEERTTAHQFLRAVV
jgi:hypothetical protein